MTRRDIITLYTFTKVCPHALIFWGTTKQKKKAKLQCAMTSVKHFTTPLPQPAKLSLGHQYECKHLEAELHQSKAEVLALRSTVARQEETISLLQHQSEESGRVFSRELKERDDRVSMLLKEIEDKSDAVATLTQQLHRSRVQLRRDLDGQVGTPSSNAAQPDDRTLPRSTNRPRRIQRTVSNPSSENVKLRSNLDAVASGPSPPPSSSEGSRPSLSASSITQRLPSPSDVTRPLLSPRPPSTSPCGGSVRRASNPLRKSVQPHSSPPLSGSLMMPTHATPPPSETYADPAAAPAQQLKLGPVQSRKRSNPPPDVASILQNQGKEMQVLGKPPPLVLPPIRLDEIPPPLPLSQSDPSLSQKGNAPEGEDGTTLTHDCTIIVGTRVHLPQGHRHIILAKSQGGVGSSPSTLRVMQYGGAAAVGEDPSQGTGEETTEGTLMVKENVSRKDQAWQELHQHGGD